MSRLRSICRPCRREVVRHARQTKTGRGDIVATSLVTQLMNEFRGDALNSVAATLGESSARTQSALGGVLPALVGGIADKSSTTDQAASLLELIKRNNLDSPTFGDVASALKAPGGINGLINMGRPLLESLLGRHTGAIADWAASLSGMNRTSSSSLLSLVVPIVLGAIAKRVRSSGWSVSNLMGLLGEQRSFMSEAPAGLADLFKRDVDVRETEEERDVGTYTSEPMHREPVVHAAPREQVGYEEPRRGSSWLWALPLLLLIPFLGYLMSRGSETRRVAVDRTPAIETPRTVVPEPMKPVATAGTETRAAVPSDIKPFTLVFLTGSSRLTPASEKQLQECADFLKAHPTARASVNGYTDNSGNADANLKLSQSRAEATMHRLEGLGIDGSRLTAQGYGESSPVADNDTAAGRLQNRRVEIRPTD